MKRVIIHGCNGAMGKVVSGQINLDADLEIVAGVDRSSSTATFPIFTNIKDCDMPADIIVDFSTAKAVPELLDYAAEKMIPIVVCTTGLDETVYKKIDEVSSVIPVFQSANMSLGVNLLKSLAVKAALALTDSGFDIEIIEKHHNQKIDAPSGTAMMLAKEINESLGDSYEYAYDRSKKLEKRAKNEIGIHAVRGGSIVGEHIVLLSGKDEIIEITHRATSKEIFAVGAIKAAKYIIEKPPGKYDMSCIMNEV